MGWVEVGAGVGIVIVVLVDLFKSVVLPRPTQQRVRLTRMLIQVTWRAWRWLALRMGPSERREGFLGSYAPFLVILLLVTGILGLVLGYGLILEGLRDQIRPVPAGFGTTLYFSAITLLTLGFGDFVPVSLGARIVVITEAGTGLGVVALIISFLFSLYGSIQRREVMVVMLEAVAGAPPSGVSILESYQKLDMLDQLGSAFAEWRLWSAEVLESHLAYPILSYFRSSHDNDSWVSALGATLDSACLVITTVEGIPGGPARLMLGVGGHLVEDLARFSGLRENDDPGVERFEFDQARVRLANAGYRLTDPELAWSNFRELRSGYAGHLDAMARYFASPPTQWIGDRSQVRHHNHRGSVSAPT